MPVYLVEYALAFFIKAADYKDDIINTSIHKTDNFENLLQYFKTFSRNFA